MKLGETITMLRKEQNMSQEDFAKLFFVTRQTISNWENEKSYPDLQTLVDMSEKFGISLDSMLKDNSQIVKKMDRNRRFAKAAKICFAALGAILCLLIILSRVWSSVWERTRQDMEARYNAALEQYGFELAEFELGHWKYAKQVDENATFWVETFFMAPKDNFHLGAYNQIITCRIRQETRTVDISFIGGIYDVPGGTVTIYDRTGSHICDNSETWSLLEADEQLAALYRQGEDLAAAFFAPWIWDLHNGFNKEARGRNTLALKKGDPAPDFTVTLTDGNTFTLSEQRGKVVLLNFWTTYCDPCILEMPAFEQLQKDYGDRLAVIAVNNGEKAATIDKFLRKTAYTFAIAVDEQETVREKYPSNGIPYTLVIGTDGIIRETHLGGTDADTMYPLYKSYIKAALAEEDNL